jgi:hypothetical protein
LFCQHETGEQHLTAGAALSAGALAERKLLLDVSFLKVHQPKALHFAARTQHHNAGIMKCLCKNENGMF